MKLYKILVINLFTYGIPTIPAYYLYKISVPFVHSGDDFVGQMMGVVSIFIVILIANHMLFGE